MPASNKYGVECFSRRFVIQENEMAIDYSVVSIGERHTIDLIIWLKLTGIILFELK